MQISSISSIATTTSGVTAATHPSSPAVVSQSSTSASPVLTTSSSTSKSAKTSSSPAPAQSASAIQETLAAVYSTTVGGKSFSGSVEESEGEYEASVAGMPGVSASGSSIQSAENNLDIKIDTLV